MSAFVTATDLVNAWDRGELVSTLKMGGLGPGYEQALQVAAIEMTRDALAACAAGGDPTGNEVRWRAHCDGTLTKHDDTLGGLSGAQYGAASWLAHQWMTIGPMALIEKARANGEGERMILVSRHWPRAAERAA